jgi:hypothetical protein
MEFVNDTRMVAGYNMGLEPSGRELLVVVIKGTFVLPKPGAELRLHEEQLPLVMADTFTGEPGKSAPLHEIDFALRKHFCDVLLNGSAHAPGGRPTQRMQVGLSVGPMRKSFEVVGSRVWQAGLTGIRSSEPKYFVRQPISYDVAFGGVDQEGEDPQDHDAFMRNPVGQGFRKQLKSEWVDGKPLPLTEESGEVVSWPNNAYKPMAFGPVGRVWQQRSCFAGTYDQAWLDHAFPFLPQDFDERYYQAAPEDQQLALPDGPMEVVLSGLTPDGLRQFMLPYVDLPVQVFPKRGDSEALVARFDTLLLEPDQARFTMTWRVARPLRKGLHEIARTVVGAKGREWWQHRERLAVVEPASTASSAA